MIFVTVGSALPFDRLIQTVDLVAGEGLLGDEVFAQIGDGTYLPKNFPFERFLERSAYASRFEAAMFVISHAGIGTISSAMRARKPIAVMPRLRSQGELVDDHQQATATRFHTMGHLLTFSDASGLKALVPGIASFEPAPRHPNAAGIAAEIDGYLRGLLAASPQPLSR